MAEDCGRGSHRKSGQKSKLGGSVAKSSRDLTYVPSQSWDSIPSHLVVAWAFGSESLSFNSGRILHLTSSQANERDHFSLKEVWGNSPAVGVGQLLRDFGILGSMQPFLEALKCAPQCFFLPLRVTKVEPWHPQPETARAGRCQAVSTQHLVRRKQHANGGAMGKDPVALHQSSHNKH